MKQLILGFLIFQSINFVHAESLFCYVEGESVPTYKLQKVSSESLNWDIFIFRNWIDFQGFELQDSNNCEFTAEKISCFFWKHKFDVNLSIKNHYRLSRRYFYSGKRTLIAPPGSLTSNLECYED